jgi:hypothetical protein
MNFIFKSFLCKFILVFFYDSLVYSVDFPSHLLHLTSVFKLLKEYHLYAKGSKIKIEACDGVT